MKPQRFEIGQAVTLKVSKKIPTQNPDSPSESIKLGEIYHVEKYYSPYQMGKAPNGYFFDGWYCDLTEIDSCVAEDILDPVELTTEQITALIEETLPQTQEI